MWVVTLFGPDISKYQAGLKLSAGDWAATSFGLARCSIGERVDPAGLIAANACRHHRVPFAAYHFPYQVSKHSATAQAATLDQALDGDRTISVMLDWESDGSEVPTFDDCTEVAAAIGDAGYRVTLLYTGTWYWQQVGSPSLDALDDLDIGVIKSDYGPNHRGEAAAIYAERGGDTGSGWSPIGGIVPTLWQYGSQVRIGNLYGDANAYRGDPADIGRWFTTWNTDPVTPPVDSAAFAGHDEPMFVTRSDQGYFYVGNGLAYRGVADAELDYLLAKQRGQWTDYRTGATVTTRDDVQPVNVSSILALGVRIGSNAAADPV